MHGHRNERAIPGADQRGCARSLARRLEARAWDLVEQRTRNQMERLEMVDAAHAARALWRIANGSVGSLETLRSHQLVACACAKSGDAAGAREAARLATACSWLDGADLAPFDTAMTMVAEYLAALAHNGFTDPGPLMRMVARLSPHERLRMSHLLPWPKERFGLEPERRRRTEARSEPLQPAH